MKLLRIYKNMAFSLKSGYKLLVIIFLFRGFIMSKSLVHSGIAGFLAVFLMLGTSGAMAQTVAAEKVGDLLRQKNLIEVQSLVMQNPSNIDTVVKELLKNTQGRISVDPEFSNRMMAMAGQYATQITPASVPVVCADLRRVVQALPEGQQGSPLHTTIVNTAQNFASAPVVVAAGRPNLCEDAWLQASNLSGDPLLFQNPGMRSPGLPPVTIGPGLPPGAPIDKPSAD